MRRMQIPTQVDTCLHDGIVERLDWRADARGTQSSVYVGYTNMLTSIITHLGLKEYGGAMSLVPTNNQQQKSEVVPPRPTPSVACNLEPSLVEIFSYRAELTLVLILVCTIQNRNTLPTPS